MSQRWPTQRETLDAYGRQVDRLLSHLGRELGLREGGAAYPVDLYEEQDPLRVEAEMPGLEKDDIDVTLGQDVVRIAADERSRGRATRSISRSTKSIGWSAP